MIYVESSRHVNERIQTQVHNPLTATLLEAAVVVGGHVAERGDLLATKSGGATA